MGGVPGGGRNVERGEAVAGGLGEREVAEGLVGDWGRRVPRIALATGLQARVIAAHELEPGSRPRPAYRPIFLRRTLTLPAALRCT
jgi:hypothetical protein